MWVNLDQIEFYHGPSNQPPSAREKQPPTYDTQFQCSLPTMPDFVQEPTNIPEYPTPLAQESSSTGMTHAWNSFDIEMSDFCNIAAPQSQMTTEMEPVVTADLSSILDTPLGLASYPLSFSEPAVFVDSATTTPSTTQQLDHIPVHVQKISSSNALPDVKDAGTPLLLSASCETASEQASNASRRMSTCDDSQQEPALPHTGTRHLSFADPGRRDEDTACELHHALHPGENPSSRATDVPERTEDGCSSGRSASVVDGPEYYPSIAVVVPAPSWKQGRVTRASTRAAAAACKKRLRSGNISGGNHRGADVIPGAERPRRKKKTRAAVRSLSSPLGDPICGSCHCSPNIYEIRGNAILTVESNSGSKPAYYFTFVPDARPTPSTPPQADSSGKQRLYSSDENALLVRLKEREGMPWSEIAEHFPDRNVSSLQVHYSTKLRHKASSRSRKRRRR